MKKLLTLTLALGLVAGSANALTIPSGSVLTTNADGSQSVVDAGSTETAKRILETQGYLVSGGSVIIAVGDNSITIPTTELVGKSQDDIKQLIVDAILDSGFASGGAYVTDLGDATDAANSAVDGLYADAVQAAVYADNIANDVAPDVAAEASNGFSLHDACHLHGQEDACKRL